MTDILEFAQQMANRYGVTVDFVAPHKKISQKSVDYRPAELDEPSMRSNENERCGNCVMYHASKCDLVEGFIQPNYVCDRWEAKPESIDLALGQRHVRTVRGEYFFKEPIGTPITEAEYQQLLAQRLAAKKEHETGHPARVAAERAVRTARRMRGGDVDTPQPESGSKNDAAQDAAAKAALEKQAQQKLAQIKQQVAVTKGAGTPSAPRSSGRSVQDDLTAARQRLAQLQQERAGRQLGRSANTAQRSTDRRLSQGQTISHFFNPDTGKMMSKSEIGDTYEQLFATHGAHLLEREFNGTYRMISHAQGGARNTPLDFQLNDTYGGELKTVSSEAKNQKTSIKKEEIDRKHLAIAKLGLQPLMVVQLVDQKSGTVTVFAHNAFASKKLSTLTKLGTYRYSEEDFRTAQKQAGYGRGGAMGASSTAPTSILDRTGLSSVQAARAEASLDKQRALLPDLAGLKRVYFSKDLPGGEENGHWSGVDNSVGLHPKLFTANADAWQARTEESGHHPKTGASALDYETAHEVGHQLLKKITDNGNWAELEKAIGSAYPGPKSFGVQRINSGLISDYGGYGGINEALAELWAEQSLSARPRNPELRDTMLRLAGYKVDGATVPAPPEKPLEGKAAWNLTANRPKLSTAAIAKISDAWFGEFAPEANNYLRKGEVEYPFDVPVSEEHFTGSVDFFVNQIRDTPPLTRSIRVLRGVIGAGKIFGKVGSKVGATYTDTGLVSTTLEPEVAQFFTQSPGNESPHGKSLKSSATVTIDLPRGTHVFRGSPEYWEVASDANDVMEYVLPPGTQYRIESDALNSAGHREIRLTVIPESTSSSTPVSEAARLTDDETYQRLLDARKEAQQKYPVGDPRRVAAERAVRQARKVIHGGGGGRAPTPRPTPTPRTPPVTRTPRTTEPTPPVPLGSGKLPATITHEYSWSKVPSVNRAFQEQAKRAVERQLGNQVGFVKELLTRDESGKVRPIEVSVTDKLRSARASSGSLGTYTGTDTAGTLRLHPAIFPHHVVLPDGWHGAPFKGDYANDPERVLQQQLDARNGSGWWVPTDSKWTLADNVIAHEVGHGVNFSAFPRFSSDAGIPDDASFWHQFADVLSKQTGYYITAPYESSITGRAADKWATRITYSDVEKWGTRNRAAIEKAISRYAAGGNGSTGTPREMFAELWSEYTLSSNPRPLAKFYGDYVAKLLNDRTRAEEKSAAEETAILRTMPADVRSFDPRSLSPGEKITFLAPHVRITKTDYGWEITLLNPDGSFQGAYGRDQPQEVTALIADIYLRKEKRKRGLT